MFPILRVAGLVVWIGVALVLVPGTGMALAAPQLLVDMRSGEVLLAKEAGRSWHPASLTKLMTALVVFEAIKAGEVDLLTPVIMSPRARKAPPSKAGFPLDTGITLGDALYLLIVKSANDVAVALAETVGGSEAGFVGRMNARAEALGMNATRYVNANGLHDRDQVTSARDLAILALTIRARFPQYAPIFATETVRLGKTVMRSHNDLLSRLAGTTGMKTGYVCSAGLNIVATVERQGKSVLAVVLGQSSARERRELTAQLVGAVFSGKITGTGRTIVALGNDRGPAPDMRPQLCGTGARAYVAGREAAFPYGLDGHPSFLDERGPTLSHRMTTLGRIRQVPLPRFRPLNAPAAGSKMADVPAGAGPPVPLPRPRPGG